MIFEHFSIVCIESNIEVKNGRIKPLMKEIIQKSFSFLLIEDVTLLANWDTHFFK